MGQKAAKEKPDEEDLGLRVRAAGEAQRILEALVNEDPENASSRTYAETRQKLKTLEAELAKLSETTDELRAWNRKFAEAEQILKERQFILRNKERTLTRFLIANSPNLLGVPSSELEVDLVAELQQLLNKAKDVSQVLGQAESLRDDAQVEFDAAMRRFLDMPQLKIEESKTERENRLMAIEEALIRLGIRRHQNELDILEGKTDLTEHFDTKERFDAAKSHVLKMLEEVLKGKRKPTIPEPPAYVPEVKEPISPDGVPTRSDYSKMIAELLAKLRSNSGLAPKPDVHPPYIPQPRVPPAEPPEPLDVSPPSRLTPFAQTSWLATEILATTMATSLTHYLLRYFLGAHNDQSGLRAGRIHSDRYCHPFYYR